MKTQEALTGFLKECEERGLSPSTRRKYWSFLRHFVDEHPELPTDIPSIEAFLKKRKETPAHRGDMFKCLQAFYAYLDRAGVLETPQMFNRPMGRPRKVKMVINPGSGQLLENSTLPDEKVVKGGYFSPIRIDLHIYLHR